MADILQSKLLPPHPQSLLDRQRLSTCFSELSHTKVTTVIAGAGYGKSTLVARGLQQAGVKTVWYRLDPFDKDFSVFMSYLLTGLGALYPDVEGTLFGDLERMAVSKEGRERFLLSFVKRLEEGVTQETVIVLDDYYLVQESAVINEALAFLLERLPFFLHLIIISRVVPPVRLSRFRVMREVVEIGERELVFTEAEIQELFSRVFCVPLKKDEIRELHEKSGGWAASLMLFRCSLNGEGDRGIEHRLFELKGSRGYVFSYLEENVFETQGLGDQEFLLKTSLFSPLEPGLCDRVLKSDDSLQRLRALEDRHLLTFSLDADRQTFFYHHLLKDFLRAKLVERLPREEICALHLAVGEAMEGENPLEALNHYLEGGWYDEATRVVESIEARFILQGKVNTLQHCLSLFPEQYRKKIPQLLMMEAKLHSCAGNPQQAIKNLTAALRLFQEAHDDEHVVTCYSNLGFQYYYSGNMREAKLFLEQIVGEIDATSPNYSVTLTFLILFAAILGDLETADAYTDQAMEALSRVTGHDYVAGVTMVDTSKAFRLYYAGDFQASLAVADRVLDMATEHGLDFCLPLTFYQYAVGSYFLGDFEKGAGYAEQGIAASEAIDLKDSQKGWVYVAWSQNCLGLGELARAESFARLGLAIFECPGNRWGMASAYDLLHQISLARKDVGAAWTSLRLACEAIEGYGLTVTEGILEIGLAGMNLWEGDTKTALRLLGESRAKVKPAAHHLLRNHLLEVECHVIDSNKAAARSVLEKALRLTGERGYAHLFYAETSRIVPLLTEFYAEGQFPFLIERLLTAMGPSALDVMASLSQAKEPLVNRGSAALLKRMPAPSVLPLTLSLLGPFTVKVGDREICPEEWTSSKALMIFQYLAAKRHTGFVHREALTELLWPEEDAAKTAKRFNVAMSALRTILEPHRSAAKGTSSYIVKQKDAYRLDTGDGGSIDVEIFLQALDAAGKEKESPLERLLAAEACWQGPFLEENPYEPWCIEAREFLNTRYLTVLSSLMVHCESDENPVPCLHFAEKYLALDPWAEPVYRKIMRLHAQMGNNAHVMTSYQACREQMEVLGCPLHEKTTALYRTLIG
ncbi:tetratricopeptide repeat protein [Desulfoluna sp.]|uniref:tetratricopeptide repeat protein n=1 Tax=Desulfoluna sp. TaxID=2045199 RepID=UPI00263256C3|nr:tetratricopeptide repeat protein [Desulfoluna sp.]